MCRGCDLLICLAGLSREHIPRAAGLSLSPALGVTVPRSGSPAPLSVIRAPLQNH